MRKLNDIVKLGFTPLNYGAVTACIIKFLNKPIPKTPKASMDSIDYDIPYIEQTYMEGMVEAMCKKALDGDVRAFESIVNRVEGMPTQQPNMMQLMALMSQLPPEVLDQFLQEYQIAQDERRLLDASDSKPS